jgi:hypothetical protein
MKLPPGLAAVLDRPATPGVLAVFRHLDSAVEAIEELKSAGRRDFTVYSPLARHELEHAVAAPMSPVRAFTLVGGISGCAIGAWISLYMSYDWPIQVGGKTIGSIPPYVVIMFEMTVLFGALTTLLGVVFNVLLGARHQGRIAYDPRFTNDRFGIFVPATGAQAGQLEALLRKCGAEEVQRG